MSNAANNIEAKTKSLLELLDKKKYEIDFFQREYKWQRKHVEDLLSDLESSFMSNYNAGDSTPNVTDYNCYYMGPIILYEKKGALHIIDGQQRLTTITLLLIYLNNLQKTMFDEDNQIEIETMIFSKKALEKGSFNLNISERKKVLEKIFIDKDIVSSEDLVNESCHNIHERISDIEQLFPPRLAHSEVLPIFIVWLSHRIVFTEIKAFTDENAYTIFETMNDRGLNLTPAEMLKSYLLAFAKDDNKIRELDDLWKFKINTLKKFSQDEDDLFFKAWLRAKYAKSIRSTQKDSENEDFEKIGTRFHTWVKENHRDLRLLEQDDYYYFVKSDFKFYCDIYIELCNREVSNNIPEHLLNLISYKGVASSLSYPLILSSITKIDSEEIIRKKIELTLRFIDAYAIFRLASKISITQSSIRNYIYNLVKKVRNVDYSQLLNILQAEHKTLIEIFSAQVDYIEFDRSYSKYLLARLYKYSNPKTAFSDLISSRKKNCFDLYPIILPTDYDNEIHEVPNGLLNIIKHSVVNFCLIPKYEVVELTGKPLMKRLEYLIAIGCFPEMSKHEINLKDLKQFFILRNKKIKEKIKEIWIL